MKKILLAAILMGILSHAFAQTDAVYYYYQGKKYYLQVTYSQLTVGVKSENSFARNRAAFSAQLQLPADSVVPASTPNQFFVNPANNAAGGKQLLEGIRKKPFVTYAHPGLLGLNNKLVSYGDAFIVKLKPGVTQQQFTALLTKYHCSIIRQSRGDKNTYQLSAGQQNNYDALGTANLFYETGSFVYAQPDFTTHNGLAAAPNDTLYKLQWAHHNTGSVEQHSGTPGADMKVDSAWQITQGDATIKIAVIDTGVDTAQADLKKNLIQGYDCVNMTANPGDGAPGNLANGHGTACAGIIGAVANNKIGIAGIAPNCKIMPVNLNDQFNNFASDFGIASGIDYSWQNGADVLTNSWYTGTPSNIIDDAIHRAVTQGRGGKGCIVFVAAGNDNAGISYPSFNPEVIAVGASSMCNQRKSPTSCDGEYWWGSSYGTGLDVMAPGVLIPTTDISGPNGYNTAAGSDGDYALTFNGTSAATPHAAAVAALVLSVNKTLTGAAVRAIIENNCTKPEQYAFAITQGNVNGSWNNEMGYGIVNAYKSVQAAQTKTYCSAGIARPATTTLCKNGTIKLSVADSSTLATYTWRLNGTDVHTGASITVNAPGDYDVVAAFPNCTAYAAAVTIHAADTAALVADAGKPVFLCPGSNGAIIGGEPSAKGGTPFIATQRAYGYDLLFSTFIRFDINNPRDYTFITPVAPPEIPTLGFVAGDFTPLGYYVLNQGGTLARVDTATGKISYIGQLAAENGQYISRTWCGLAWNPVTKKLYGFTTGNLADGVYEIDPITAHTKLIIYQGQYSFLTWHTFNNKGSLFGYSPTYNKIYRSKSLDVNAQTFGSDDIGVSMLAQLDGSFDPLTNKLYFTTYAYAQTLFGDLREVDTVTGKITVDGAIGRTSETGALAIAGGTYKYTWGPAAGLSNIHDANPIANPTSTTTYTLTVTDACGNTANSQVVVTANAPKPVINIKASKDSICIGDSSRLSVTQNPAYTYQWYFNGLLLKNVTDTTYTTGRGGNFKVSVAYGRGGCLNTSKTFTVKDCSVWLKNNNTDTTCFSYLYPPHGYIDSGIMPSEHFVKTIYPSKPGDRLRITFSQIDIKSVFSKLSIYDGPSTASPLLRTISFYDYLNQKAYYTSSTGPLTFELQTGDQPDNIGIWDAFLTCITPYVYVSKQSGSFGDASTWLIKTGEGVYENATKPPVYTDDSIIIRTGHTVTVTGYYGNQVDEVWVQKGASLVFNDGLQISGGGSFGLVVDGDLVLNGVTQLIAATKVYLRGGFTTNNPSASIAGAVYVDGTAPQVFNLTGGTNMSSIHVLNKKGLTIHGRIITDSLFINTPGGLTMDSSLVRKALKLDTGVIHIPLPGVMDLTSYNMIIDPGSKTSYIDGAVLRGLTADYTVHYPIGTAKAFRPLDFAFEKYVNDNFTVRVVDSPAPARPLPVGISRVSTQNYYNVKMARNYPFAGLAVKIPYYKGDGITDPAHLRIVRDSSGRWVNIGGSGTHADTGTITSTGKFTLIGSFALANADSGTNTLPVTWLNFTAALKNKQALLQWDVTREINISHYAVEHSTDGLHFSELAQVAVHNNTGGNNSYQYLHTNLQQGVNYYRIKEVDKDGKYAYTKIIAVNAGSTAVIVSPNPAHDVIIVTAGNTIQQVDCYNAVGQLVKTVTPASNKCTIDVKQLAAGVYTVRVITATGTYNTKVVKE